MRRSHLDRFTPGCPVCGAGHLLSDAATDVAGNDVLTCDQSACGARHPVVDGVPIIVADLPSFLASQLLNVADPDAITGPARDVIGDAAGPGGAFDARRQNLSTYTWGHWGDLDPVGDGPKEGSISAVLDRALDVLAASASTPDGPTLDLGCGLGRTSLELAKVTGDLVLGIELNLSFARAAARTVTTGHVAYDLRSSGTRYEARSFDVPTAGADQVDVWCADVAVLPVQERRFGLVTSLNLLDCVRDPRTHLQALHDLLVPGGTAIISTPFDWAPSATDPAHWLGGRTTGTFAGDSPAVVRGLLGGGADGIEGFALVGELEALPWDVRLHARSITRYLVDVFVVRRTD